MCCVDVLPDIVASQGHAAERMRKVAGRCTVAGIEAVGRMIDQNHISIYTEMSGLTSRTLRIDGEDDGRREKSPLVRGVTSC